MEKEKRQKSKKSVKSSRKRTAKKATPEERATRTKLAKALGIGARTVTHMRNNHDGPVSNDVEVWRAYLEERATETTDPQTIENLSEELKQLRARLLRAQAGKEEATRKLRELELKRQQSNLVPMSEARAAIRKVLAPLRGLLDSLPRAVALQANPADPTQAEEAVTAGLDKMLEMIAQEMEKQNAQ